MAGGTAGKEETETALRESARKRLEILKAAARKLTDSEANWSSKRDPREISLLIALDIDTLRTTKDKLLDLREQVDTLLEQLAALDT